MKKHSDSWYKFQEYKAKKAARESQKKEAKANDKIEK